MKKRYIAGGVLAVLLLGAGTFAYVAIPTVHAGAPGEAPELGRTGEFTLGTATQSYTLPYRTKIGAMSAISGNLDASERILSVRFWYPATVPDGATPESYHHTLRPSGQPAVEVVSQGLAFAEAPPFEGEKFPLILMSHGFNGWEGQFSNLAEHIASRGYVVASINHADPSVEGIADTLLSFANVLVDRTQDQRQVLSQILAGAQNGSTPAATLIDTDSVGLIGYSMGGYGALASAGADYHFTGSPLENLPTIAQDQLRAATAKPLPIKALVTFAPWGGQPDDRAWVASSLSKITTPTLIIAGDQDDVVDYNAGVRWLFENMTGADRYMLVFREARHNIVGNAFTFPEGTSFTAIEYLNEPVWRGERLNAINQHFVTAFLDMTLKGDASKAAYLQVPSTNSNDSKWEVGFGEQLNGKMAGDDQPGHWRGFQRRWALGLEMYTAKKGSFGSVSKK